jgi:hypothetical protein
MALLISSWPYITRSNGIVSGEQSLRISFEKAKGKQVFRHSHYPMMHDDPLVI